MNQTRTFLLLGMLLVAYLLWTAWPEQFHPALPAAPTQAGQTAASSVAAQPTVPSMPAAATEAGPAPTAAAATAPLPTLSSARGTRIHVRTDLLDVTLDSAGGALLRAQLLHYAVQPQQPARVSLLDDHAGHYLVAQSGLISTVAAPAADAPFSAGKTDYTLTPGQNRLAVDLTWRDAARGISVIKRYVFTRGSYVVRVREIVHNSGTAPWTGNAWTQLLRTAPPTPQSHFGFLHDPSSFVFSGAAWYSPQDKFNKLALDAFAKHPLSRSVAGGWLAFVQHYFLAAWIPPTQVPYQFSSAEFRQQGVPYYVLRGVGPTFSVAPGASASQEQRLYIGPKRPSLLQAAAPGLDLSVDYGIFTVIAQPLHWILVQLHRITFNWGLAIILLVLLIKGAFFWLSDKQYRSMAKMRKLAPRLKALQERYADDKTKMQQAVMELYQKEKVNPLSGCWPMLVQIPVFFALYWVLIESVELRQAPFVLWIHNLSAPDPYFVLPALNAGVMLLQQFLTPVAGMDPTQAKIMKFMPLVMAVFFAVFPAGLVLYYLVNSLTGVMQQWWVLRQVQRADAAKT